eukprot:6117297-Pleurochrysis_carterae.AAC.1
MKCKSETRSCSQSGAHRISSHPSGPKSISAYGVLHVDTGGYQTSESVTRSHSSPVSLARHPDRIFFS